MTMERRASSNPPQVGFGIDIERDMLHHARRHVSRRPSGMRNAFDRLNFCDIRMLHECNRGAVTQTEKSVKGIFDAVHPVKRDELHTHDLGKVLDLLLDVFGADREGMYSVG